METNNETDGHEIFIHQIYINNVENFYYNEESSPDNGKGGDITYTVEQHRQEIRIYIDKVRCFVVDEWREQWPVIWNEIIINDDLKDKILLVGKQREATFNRSLVANIIHLLGDEMKMMKPYNATKIAEILEGNKNHSVRMELGIRPEEKEIIQIVKNIVARVRT